MTDITNLESWVGHSYDRLRVDLGKPKGAQSEYTVYTAKGETEGFAVGIRASEDGGKLKFVLLGGGVSGVACTLYHVRESMTVNEKTYTDPAVPVLDGDTFELEANKTSAFLVEFQTEASAPEGEHAFEFGFVNEDGETVASHKAVLHIWNFTMPEKKTFRTAMGYDDHDQKRDHYDILFDHNLCGYFLPVSFMSEEGAELLSNPRLTSVRFPHWWEPVALGKVYDRIRSNPEWLDKTYIYPMDEPSTVESLVELEKKSKDLRERYPGIRHTSPYYKNVQYAEGIDQVEAMSEYIDMHCPKLALWDDTNAYEEIENNPFPSFKERMEALQARGDSVWTYVCNYPEAPYLNVKLDDPGIESRILFWQIYQRNIEGFLYWRSNYWTKLPEEDPWQSLDTFGNGILGDGILVYPGQKIGRDKPIPSIRLKLIRDGIDDIELLYYAEKVVGKEWAKEKAAKVSKSLTTVDVTSDEFAALRIEIGNAIEKMLNK